MRALTRRQLTLSGPSGWLGRSKHSLISSSDWYPPNFKEENRCCNDQGTEKQPGCSVQEQSPHDRNEGWDCVEPQPVSYKDRIEEVDNPYDNCTPRRQYQTFGPISVACHEDAAGNPYDEGTKHGYHSQKTHHQTPEHWHWELKPP